jgi:hypothetical protein
MPEQEQESVETTVDETNPVSVSDDGNIKLDMGKFNTQNEATEEDIPKVTLTPVEEEIPETPSEPTVVPEATVEEVIEDSIIEEITEEEVVEQVETIAEEIEQAVVEQDMGVPLPENIQKVVDFMN